MSADKAQPKLLHVAVALANPARVRQYEHAFDKAKDWLRYAPNCWILWTAKSADSWSRRLRQVVKPGESYLICELNFENHQGWLTKKSWDWINERAFGAKPSDRQDSLPLAR